MMMMMRGRRTETFTLVVAVVLLALVRSGEAKRAGGGAGAALGSRGGNNGGVDNEGKGGEIDQTTIIVSACFGGLAVLFCGKERGAKGGEGEGGSVVSTREKEGGGGVDTGRHYAPPLTRTTLEVCFHTPTVRITCLAFYFFS